MDQTIIGRREELKILHEIYESEQPEFLAIYGRRRVGKTYLISEFFKNKGIYFEITGMNGGTMVEQLFQFSYEFSRLFNGGNPITSLKNWTQAFHLLHEALEKIDKEKKVILFFDEVPWLASPRSKFLNILEHFWNRYLSRKKNLVLIICGSSASWVIRNVINNKAGLYGRITRKIRLLPFSLLETEEFFKSRNIELDRKQIIEIYMAIGGIPKYLSYIVRGKSAAQNINNLCFTINGALYDEFEKLYQSLFDNYKHHIAIVKTLAKSINGLSKNELLSRIKLVSGGSSSKIIEELIDAGFIIYMPSFNKRKTKGIYRLIDEYSIFYLTWIKEHPPIAEGIDSELWLKKYGSSKWNSWSGSAFEALCLKHIMKIKKALGISGINTIESEWHYFPKKDKKLGAQIDLVIERSDKCINLCEIKYSDSEFLIDKTCLENLQNKKKVFKEQTNTTKTLFMTIITTYGVKKNSHYLSIIDNQLTMEDLFI